MKQLSVIIFLVTLFTTSLAAKDGGPGYNIKVKLNNYTEKELIIGFHFGEKTYVKDTATLGVDGFFTFRADTLFPPGVYLLVTKPDNNFIQILLPSDDQDLTITTNAKDAVNNMEVSGSTENKLFYGYLQFLNGLRPEADTLKSKLAKAKGNPKDSTALATQLAEIDKRVKKYQIDFIEKNKNTISARIIRGSLEPEMPVFEGTEREIQTKRYYWYRAHYFDNIDVADPVMLRSPILHGKIDNYINKVVPQHPDSINVELDKLLLKMSKSDENFRYYLIHFLNYYAKSKLVGFDACYVHLGKNYYCNGRVTWADKEDIEKICDNVRRLEPILIGKTAPNIVVTDRNNAPHELWTVDADYTVLFFWAPDCGHCKKIAPNMVEFAKAYQNKGVKVFAVCTSVGADKAGECWKGVEEKGFTDDIFMNMHDPLIRSRYKQLYDVQTTPQIFILDRKHTILMKRIGAEELGKVMDQVMKFEEEKKQGK